MSTSRRLSIGLATLSILAATPAVASAKDYFVSPSGSDSAAGTVTAPWKTVNKVNNASLLPGDTVSFQGGASFNGDLMPYKSGTAAAPITFKSYGTGKATLSSVWMKSVSYLNFQDLSAVGTGQNWYSSGAGTGVTHIRFTRTEAHNGTMGWNAANTLDQDWNIQDCVVDSTQDTGIHSWASDTTVQGCKISNTGLGYNDYSYSLHGMYIDGARLIARNNEISNNWDPTGQAISTRYRDALIENNSIHDVDGGIGYFRDDVQSGTTVIRRNKFSNIRQWVLYIGPGNRAAGQGENWQVYNNTVVNTKAVSGPAIAWSSTGGKELIFRNNAIQGFGSLWRSTTGITQSNNFLGSLGVVNFVPQSGSKLLNAGTATIKASAVSLANTCNATALSYCGTAPELGAVEAPATLR